MRRCVVGLAALGLLISCCAKTPPSTELFVSCEISERIDSDVAWRRGHCQDESVVAFIESAILEELTADKAIQIALCNNPKVQALFEELGIAQADLLEAGLFSNPSFEVEVRYPHTNRLHTNIEYLITAALLDIFLVPARVRLASTESEQTKLQVTNGILDLALDVRKTFYELAGEEEKIHYLRTIADLTAISNDLFIRQAEVGNINNLSEQLSQSRLINAKLELEQSEAGIARLREKLNRLLGLSLRCQLNIARNQAGDVKAEHFDLCTLEGIALEERLDLQIARLEIHRIGQMLGLKDWWTYTNLHLGLAGEREPDGANLLGPGFAGEVPLFNYGQAERMRLYSQLRQALHRLEELEVVVHSEVAEAYELFNSYRNILTTYQAMLLPVQSHILSSTEEQYNVMGVGIDQLLEARSQVAVAKKNYADSVIKFMAAKVDLDRAIGGDLYKLLDQKKCTRQGEK